MNYLQKIKNSSVLKRISIFIPALLIVCLIGLTGFRLYFALKPNAANSAATVEIPPTPTLSPSATPSYETITDQVFKDSKAEILVATKKTEKIALQIRTVFIGTDGTGQELIEKFNPGAKTYTISEKLGDSEMNITEAYTYEYKDGELIKFDLVSATEVSRDPLAFADISPLDLTGLFYDFEPQVGSDTDLSYDYKSTQKAINGDTISYTFTLTYKVDGKNSDHKTIFEVNKNSGLVTKIHSENWTGVSESEITKL